MTAPEQPYPDMTAAIGEGAFEVSGGPTNAYGSTLTTSAIDTITKGQQATGVTSGSTALTKLQGYIGSLPAEALPLFGAAFGLTGPDVTALINFISPKMSQTGVSVNDALTRFTNDGAVLWDLLHLTYAAGTPTDPPGTLWTGGGIGNGKVTWYAALNDMLALFGTANSTTAPAAQPTTVGTAVALQAAYTARITKNDTILLDWFHTTYPLGTSTDTAATLVGGVRTWWGAWNDNLLAISQMLGVAPATTAAVDIGGTVNANAATVTTHLNTVAAAAGTTGSTPLTAAANGMDLITSTLASIAAAIQSTSTQNTGNSNSGMTLNIAFNAYSTWSAVPVNTTYGNIPGASSHGSGTFVIDSQGHANWNAVTDGDVSAIAIYNGGGGPAVTLTDYQKISASLAGFPTGGNAKNFVVCRANAGTNPGDYVYGVVYLNTSFQLVWELGCYISGTQHIWGGGSVGTLNLNFTMIAGVGNNPNRYQGFCGNTLVFDHVNVSGDPGGVFPVGSTHRYWGFRSDTYGGGQYAPAPASYIGAADNLPPTVPGSGIRMYRTNTASEAQATAMGQYIIAPSTAPFFDTVAEASTDMAQVTTTVGSVNGSLESAIQVANAGRYIASMRAIISAATCSAGAVSICPTVSRFNSLGVLQETRYFPSPGFFTNGFGGQYNAGFFGGSEAIACVAGDILVAGYFLSGGPTGAATGALSALSFTGESTGEQTYFEVTLANWSLS